jgi:hypothetical protein
MNIDNILKLGNDALNGNFDIKCDLPDFIKMRIMSLKEGFYFFNIKIRVDEEGEILKEISSWETWKKFPELKVKLEDKSGIEIIYSELEFEYFWFEEFNYCEFKPLYIVVDFTYKNREVKC